MDGQVIELLKLIGTFCAGGLGGAVLNEYWRRRRARTRTIPVEEFLNEEQEPSGSIRLVRKATDGNLVPVNKVRRLAVRITNTTEQDLRDAEIQFEFQARSVETPPVRTTKANAELIRLPVSTPGLTLRKLGSYFEDGNEPILRWKFTQFPSGDSVSIFFEIIEPVDGEYKMALYKADNVILKKVDGTDRSIGGSADRIAFAVPLAAMAGAAMAFATARDGTTFFYSALVALLANAWVIVLFTIRTRRW